jgi:HlyD family secretion protein
MPATFTVDAYPGETFRGIIREIRSSPQVIQNVVTYDAVVDVDNFERLLKPGMTATVTFVYAQRADALRISNAALRFKPRSALFAASQREPAPPAWSARHPSTSRCAP